MLDEIIEHLDTVSDKMQEHQKMLEHLFEMVGQFAQIEEKERELLFELYERQQRYDSSNRKTIACLDALLLLFLIIGIGRQELLPEMLALSSLCWIIRAVLMFYW